MEPQLYWYKHKRIWWVAKEVIDPPEELTSRTKKPPVAVVTFFSEPEIILRVTNAAAIVKYDTDKESYIRKGLQYLKQIKSSETETWKKDVRKAEESINGEVNIIERIENETHENAKPKKSVVAEIFGTPKPKTAPSVSTPATPAKTPGKSKRPPVESSSLKKPQVKSKTIETPKGKMNCWKCHNFPTDKVEILVSHMRSCKSAAATKPLPSKPRSPRKSTPRKAISEVAKTASESETPKKQRGRPRKSAGTPTKPKATGSSATIPDSMSNDTSLKDALINDWSFEEDDAPKNTKPDPSSMFDKLLERTQTTEAHADAAASINEVEESAPSENTADVDVKPELAVPTEDDDITAKFNEIMGSTEPVKRNQDLFGNLKLERTTGTCQDATELDAADTSNPVTKEGSECDKRNMTTAKIETATRKRGRPADSTPTTTNRRSTRKAPVEVFLELPARRRRGPSKADSQSEIVPGAEISQEKERAPPQIITYSPARGRRSSNARFPAKEVSTSVESSKPDSTEQIPTDDQTQELPVPVVEESSSTRRGRRPSSVVIHNEPQQRRSQRSSRSDASVENQTPTANLKKKASRHESPKVQIELPKLVSESQNSGDNHAAHDLQKEFEPPEIISDSVVASKVAEAVTRAAEQTHISFDVKDRVEEVVGDEQVVFEQEVVGETLSEEVKLQEKAEEIFAKKTLPDVNESVMEVDISDSISNGHMSTPKSTVEVPAQKEATTLLSRPEQEVLPKVGSKRKQSFGDLSSGYGQIELEGPTPPKQRTIVDRRGSKELIPVAEEPKVVNDVEIEENGDDPGAEDTIDEVQIPAGEYDGKVVHVLPVEDEDGSITYMVYALDQDNDHEPQEPMHAIYIEEGKNLDLTTIMQSLQAAPDEAGDSQSEGTAVTEKHEEVKTVKMDVDTNSSTNAESGSGIPNNLISETERPTLLDTPSAVTAAEQ